MDFCMIFVVMVCCQLKRSSIQTAQTRYGRRKSSDQYRMLSCRYAETVNNSTAAAKSRMTDFLRSLIDSHSPLCKKMILADWCSQNMIRILQHVLSELPHTKGWEFRIFAYQRLAKNMGLVEKSSVTAFLDATTKSIHQTTHTKASLLDDPD